MKISNMHLSNVGPIKGAQVNFGDLTILLGANDLGKSIFLQLFRLALDYGYINDQLTKHGIDWNGSLSLFLESYLGAGLQNVWQANSSIKLDNKPINLKQIVQKPSKAIEPAVFYIPAQRLLMFSHNWIKPFTEFRYMDPFAIKDFSETLRRAVDDRMMKKRNYLKPWLMEAISKDIFGNLNLDIAIHSFRKSVVLGDSKKDIVIPIDSCSIGQRAFVPLLLGIQWLLHKAANKKGNSIKWVIIEEPELGLQMCTHSSLFSSIFHTLFLLIIELLQKGYYVCISTHSEQIYALAWLARYLKSCNKYPSGLITWLQPNNSTELEDSVKYLCKRNVMVYEFDNSGRAVDISQEYCHSMM